MSFTYVCIIIGGIIKEIKGEFIQGGSPSYRAKTARDRKKINLDGQFTYKTKKVYHLWTSNMYVLLLEVLEKKLKVNLSMAEVLHTEQKL